MKRVKKNEKGYNSRVERNSLKNRTKRRIKNNIKDLPKMLIKNLIYLLVGFIYTLYLIIRTFNNMIAKLFMMLPRIVKVAVIYILI